MCLAIERARDGARLWRDFVSSHEARPGGNAAASVCACEFERFVTDGCGYLPSISQTAPAKVATKPVTKALAAMILGAVIAYAATS